MTPKSLLRLPEAKSAREEFINGRFLEVIDDNSNNKKDEISKVLLTSGKVYYDILKYKNENKINDAAIIRLEQFYPYKSEMIKEILFSYSKAKDVVWVQEEPRNMGAWNFLSPRLIGDLADSQKLSYSGRPEGASPAVGSAKISKQQQQELIELAFK
jgi:2-oxoglutarate dehydrogenase E1 component